MTDTASPDSTRLDELEMRALHQDQIIDDLNIMPAFDRGFLEPLGGVERGFSRQDSNFHEMTRVAGGLGSAGSAGDPQRYELPGSMRKRFFKL